MRKLSWDKTCFLEEGRPVFLVSGEFHYFRVPREDWESRLLLFKEAGGNCAATYIPWIIHERTEGDIKFSDTGYRDLEGFLTLCRKLGLYVIARPGPYQYSELKYHGLPEWLCENYPEIRAKNINGEEFAKASVSYMHPVFLEKAYSWFKAVCPVIAAHSVKNGGAVAFVQFDNELAGIHEWFSGWDYNARGMEIGKKGGAYYYFLANKYGEAGALNAAYGSRYGDFDQVRPADFASFGKDNAFIAESDYRDYYFERVAQYAETLTGWMKEFGIDNAFVHNSANCDMNSYFLETCKKLGDGFLLGSDHYYNLNMDWEQNNPTPQYAAKCLLSCEILRNMGYPPTVFELPGGSASDWPPITPEDLSCCYYTNLAFGMKGLNYYIFTGGPNRENTGGTCEIYDYGASISADNKIRPVYYALKDFGNFLKDNSWLAGSRRMTDIAVGFDAEYQRSRKMNYGKPGKISTGQAWDTMRKGVVISSLCASLSPEIVDINDAEITGCKKTLVFAAAHILNKKAQNNMAELVKRGGNLIVLPAFPEADENLAACTVLKSLAGAGSIEPCSRESPTVSFMDIENIYINGSVFVDHAPPEDAKILGTVEDTGEVCSWKKSIEGGGSIIWFGVSWVHAMNEHHLMTERLVNESCNTGKIIECNNANIWSSLWSSGSRYMLFSMNLFSAPMTARITVNTGGDKQIIFNDLEWKPMEVKKLQFII